MLKQSIYPPYRYDRIEKDKNDPNHFTTVDQYNRILNDMNNDDIKETHELITAHEFFAETIPPFFMP